MPTPRDFPYIWASWLPRLLTGENSCEWAAWFKAHHQSWERVPSDFDQAKWMLDHTALLNQRIADWTLGGHDIDTEAQNRFELHGKTAILAGRPDIIAHREDHAVIIDAKTGHDSPSHAVQVMISCTPSPGRSSGTGAPNSGARSPTATTRSALRQRPSTSSSARTWAR